MRFAIKVCILIDKESSAIGRLMRSVQKHLPHLSISVVALHPKRADPEQITEAVKAFEECDVFHAAYWKSAERLKLYVDEKEFKKKTKILSHFNPYDI